MENNGYEFWAARRDAQIEADHDARFIQVGESEWVEYFPPQSHAVELPLLWHFDEPF
jgi:hypothetical protein